MDFSSFKLSPSYHNKKIGKYELFIFRGERPYTKSIPKDDALSIDQYTVLGLSVDGLDLKTFGFDFEHIIALKTSYSKEWYYYNLPIAEIENVYNKLCELAGETVKDNKITEKPCFRCGKMNDLDAVVCWSFTCGVNNPTR